VFCDFGTRFNFIKRWLERRWLLDVFGGLWSCFRAILKLYIVILLLARNTTNYEVAEKQDGPKTGSVYMHSLYLQLI
jgi:hypothetical protein